MATTKLLNQHRNSSLALHSNSSKDAMTLSTFSGSEFTRALLGMNATGEATAYLGGERRCKDVCVFLNVILDNSGSMLQECGGGKTRLQVALDCLDLIVRSRDLQLARPDSLVVHTFNQDVISRLICHPDRYDHNRLVTDIQENSGGTNSTRMRDAIFEALKNMETGKHAHVQQRQGKKVVRYLLVLTDGQDNKSNASTEQLVERLKQANATLKNLHLVVIAAGLTTAGLNDLSKLCGKGVDVRVVKVDKVDHVNIKQAFEAAMEYLRCLIYRDAAGKVTTALFVERDKAKVDQMDKKAEVTMATFQTTYQIESFKAVQKLFLEFRK